MLSLPHADIVGSLIRPPKLLAAREEFGAGRISPAEFTEALKTSATDAEVEAWLKANHPKSEADIEAYNERMIQMGPTDERYQAIMAKMLNKIAPERTDINTWFALMDLDDEKTFAL